MDSVSREAVCYTRVVRSVEEYPDVVDRLFVFDGWSIVADQETFVELDSEPSVYFEGDRGVVKQADFSDADSFLVEGDYDESVSVEVPLYIPSDSEKFASDVPDLFIRNIGKEDVFWFPSPTYLFDTVTGELLRSNSINFDPNRFIDGFIVSEGDVSDDEVVLIENVRTEVSSLYSKDFVEDQLGSRFHALKRVRG